jgi:hypothetical protein
MKVTFDLTEWQLLEIAQALEDRAAQYPPHELECLLNLSLLQQEFLSFAKESLRRDLQALKARNT